jgi:transketolase
VFSDYMRPPVRLAALMGIPVTYVWTHDSIGLGEDGPTHQPIEHLAALRAIPGLIMLRPGDANETAAGWRAILEQHAAPVGLALTRQNLPVLEGTKELATEGVARGAYVLADASNGDPRLVLIGTGSELQIAVEARKVLEADGVATRVVSMPSMDWFEAQDETYRDQVIPPSVRARVSVEAGIAQPWYRYVGDAGEIISIEHYGASADYQTLYREFGITTEAVVEAARKSLRSVEGNG